jgi:hypothetical protein
VPQIAVSISGPRNRRYGLVRQGRRHQIANFVRLCPSTAGSVLGCNEGSRAPPEAHPARSPLRAPSASLSSRGCCSSLSAPFAPRRPSRRPPPFAPRRPRAEPTKK